MNHHNRFNRNHRPASTPKKINARRKRPMRGPVCGETQDEWITRMQNIIIRRAFRFSVKVKPDEGGNPDGGKA